MKRAMITCAALLGLAAGCAHAKTAADAQQEERAAQGEQGAASGESAEEQDSSGTEEQTPGADRTPVSGTDDDSPGEERRRERIEQGDDDTISPKDIEVATSPEGLLRPGAEDKVREKLGMEPGDRNLHGAIRRFQREQQLPVTGILDHETVEKLGLSPDEIFQTGSSEK